jgi:ABC-2 type transport system permease protein
MSLWRLELLRMVRTHRWTILAGIYLFFGVLGPVGARYLNELVSTFAGDVTIIVPDPRPVDGIAQFLSNVTQLGVLAVVVVGASALAVDARSEIAAFLRTRVPRSHDLLLPRYTVVAATSMLALALGTGVAWALTLPLLGELAVGPMLLGTLLGALYLAFAVAVVAVAGAWLGGLLPTVLASLLVLLVLPVLGVVPQLQPWLPSHLVLAVVGLLEGEAPSAFLRATVVTVVLTPALLVLAGRLLGRREL